MVIMNDQHFAKKGFNISSDKELLNFDVIYNYLENESYWGKGIPPDTLRKSIANSLCFGVYHENDQIGFAKVVTDKATFAYLADVFILKQYRGQGLSKWLIQTVKQHPELQGLRRWNLITADAHGLYAQFGFEPVNNPERYMQIFTPYQKQ